MQRGQLAGWGDLVDRADVLGTSSRVSCPVEIPVYSLDDGTGPTAVVPVETEQRCVSLCRQVNRRRGTKQNDAAGAFPSNGFAHIASRGAPDLDRDKRFET